MYLDDKNVKRNNTLTNFVLIVCILALAVYIAMKYFFKEDTSSVNNNTIITQTTLPTFENPFEEAEFVYAWFNGHNPIQVNENEKKDDYRKVAYEEISNIEEMKSYLSTIFSSDIVDSLINTQVDTIPLFKNIGNQLYAYYGFVNQYSYQIQKNMYVEKIDETHYIYHVSMSMNNDTKKCEATYDYNYVDKQNNGSFVFENFEQPIKLCLDNSKANS